MIQGFYKKIVELDVTNKKEYKDGQNSTYKNTLNIS